MQGAGVSGIEVGRAGFVSPEESEIMEVNAVLELFLENSILRISSTR